MRWIKKLIVNKYEIVLFPKDFYVSDISSLLEESKKIDIFSDGANSIIPLPPNAPREIPRILLRSKDSSIQCNIGFDKVNIVWVNSKESEGFKKSLADILNLTVELSEVLFPHIPTHTVKRIGYIQEFFAAYEKPLDIISETVLGGEVKTDLKEFTCQLLYGLQLETYSECNQVFTLATGKKQTGEKENVLMLTNDINTLQTKDVNWKIEEIKKFITEVNRKSDKKDLGARFLKQNE